MGNNVLGREKISYADRAWLRMENPKNLMTITSVMMFDEKLDEEHLKAIIKHRLLKFNRFRQRVVKDGSLHWEDVDKIDMDYHLQKRTLSGEGDDLALEKLASDEMSKLLDYSKPLWQMILVENYGKGNALIVRINHGIADGIALIRVLISLTDDPI